MFTNARRMLAACGFAMLLLFAVTKSAFAQLPSPPFNECPPAGLDTSCRLLIVITKSGSQVLLTDPNASPTYDGNDDTLVGVLNLSPKPVTSIPLTSQTDIFGFDGDGICSSSISPNPPGCPYGPTGYEGPGVSYGSINASQTSGTVNFSPAIAANGGSTYFGLEEAIPTQCQDTDGDGLCDDWETYGLYVYVNGVPVFVDLPSMGADPNHKDVFLQTDYMVDPGICLPIVGCLLSHTHQPKADAIALMTKAYQDSPVTNPDGTTGIHLHVDCGPSCIMNPVTNQTWGALSQANALAEQTTIGSTSGGNYLWADFDAIKTVNFNDSRSQVFHYVVFAHDLGGLGSTSGISRGIPSADLIVSLGSWTNSTGTALEQGGTLMHETGHNLSLQHGGTDGVNYKPNFLSVMNYYFQTAGLVKGGVQGTFDYSRLSLPSLDETALNENVGLGAAAAGYGTIRACPGTTTGILVPVANGPIDWNCNTTIDLLPVAADINQDTHQTTLTSYNDWPNLVYMGGAIGGLGLSLTPPAATPIMQELTTTMDAQIPKEYKVIVSVPGAAQLPPGGSIDLKFSVSNAGTKSDTYALASTTSTSWADLSGVPSSVSLGAGAQKSFTVHVAVPAGTALGAADTLSLKATSASNASVMDTGYTAVSTQIATKTTLTVTPSSMLKAGEELTVVATVTATTGTVIPTGTVTFSSPSGSGTIQLPLNAAGQATFKRPAPKAGTYTLGATYNGATNFIGSVSTPVTQTVH